MASINLNSEEIFIYVRTPELFKALKSLLIENNIRVGNDFESEIDDNCFLQITGDNYYIYASDETKIIHDTSIVMDVYSDWPEIENYLLLKVFSIGNREVIQVDEHCLIFSNGSVMKWDLLSKLEKLKEIANAK